MQGGNDRDHCVAAAERNEDLVQDECVIAVTAINHRGRVLTVVSRSDAGGCSPQAVGPMCFTTTILSGPLGQLTWTAETTTDALRNHETAVCKLIQSIASDRDI